jgi:type IV pilus assembly protein PilM
MWKFSKTATPSSFSCLNCDIDENRITVAEIESSGNVLTLKKVRQLSRPASTETDSQKFVQSILECGFTAKRIRIAMRGYGVVVRFIQFPKMKPEDLRSALTFEAEKFIPFKAADVVFDYCILDSSGSASESSKEMSLLLVAIKRDEIYPLIELFRSAQLEPELVDVNALAFLNSVGLLNPDPNESFVGMLDISSTISTLTIAKNGVPLFIRDISFGETDILKRLKLLLGNNEAKLSEIMTPGVTLGPDVLATVKEALKGLCTDLKISLNYFIEHNHLVQPVSKLHLGGRWNSPVLADILSQILNMPVNPVNFSPRLSVDSSVSKDLLDKTAGLMPILVGLAARKL